MTSPHPLPPVRPRRRLNDRKRSEPDKRVELVTASRNVMNVSRGGVGYEKAKSRRQRHRAALMEHSAISRDVAVPLSSAKSRVAGKAVLVREGDDDDGDEAIKVSLGIARQHCYASRPATMPVRAVSIDEKNKARRPRTNIALLDPLRSDNGTKRKRARSALTYNVKKQRQA